MKFILGFITGWIVFILAIVGLYFYFDVGSYDLVKEDLQDTQTNTNEDASNNHQQSQSTEQKHNGYETPATKQDLSENENNPQHSPNLHDKQKAIQLMKQERSSLSDEEKQMYDGVIETAKSNINKGVPTQEDYNILNAYKGMHKHE